MVRQILPNNNEKCYMNFSPKNFTSKHGLTKHSILLQLSWPAVVKDKRQMLQLSRCDV
jgi:hypothetical protein